MAKFLSEMSAADYQMLEYMPSQQAAASLTLAIKLLGRDNVRRKWVSSHMKICSAKDRASLDIQGGSMFNSMAGPGGGTRLCLGGGPEGGKDCVWGEGGARLCLGGRGARLCPGGGARLCLGGGARLCLGGGGARLCLGGGKIVSGGRGGKIVSGGRGARLCPGEGGKVVSEGGGKIMSGRVDVRRLFMLQDTNTMLLHRSSD